MEGAGYLVAHQVLAGDLRTPLEALTYFRRRHLPYRGTEPGSRPDERGEVSETVGWEFPMVNWLRPRLRLRF